MILFQYWDTPDLPPDIASWVLTLREQNPGYDHRLYSRNKAAKYIGSKVGDRERLAFLQCAVPAGQADYFRLCAMVAEGGLYLDADSQPVKPLASLMDDIPRALLCTYADTLNNSIMLFRAPAHPFTIDCLNLATDNIENRRFGNVSTSTGPSMISAVYAVTVSEKRAAILAAHDNAAHAVKEEWFSAAQSVKVSFPELLAVAEKLIQPTKEKLIAFQGITLLHAFRTLAWIGPQQPAYKSTARHWVNWKGSIYFSKHLPLEQGPATEKSTS